MVKVGDRLCVNCRMKHRAAVQQGKQSDLVEETGEEEDADAAKSSLQEIASIEPVTLVEPSGGPLSQDVHRQREAKKHAEVNMQVQIQSLQSDSGSHGHVSIASCGSTYSESGENLLEVFNNGMTSLSHQTGKQWSRLRYRLSEPVSSMGESTQREFKARMREGMSIIAELMSPGYGDELVKASVSGLTVEGGYVPVEVLDLLAQPFQNASTVQEKRVLLTIAAAKMNEDGSPTYTKKQLMDFFSVTKHQVDQAKKQAATVGPGVIVAKEKLRRIRLDLEETEHFFEYLLNNDFLQLMSWGSQVLKFESGAEEEIGGVLQATLSSSAIQSYHSACLKEGRKALSERTCYRLLNEVIHAKKAKAVAGLDNIADDGEKAVVSLKVNVVEKLRNHNLGYELCKRFQAKLDKMKAYLKTDFIAHAQGEEGEHACAHHCPLYVLSAAGKQKLSEDCPHSHDLQCTDCEEIESLFSELQGAIQAVGLSGQVYEDLQYDLKEAVNSIRLWKAHTLRAQQQSKARSAAMEQLDSESCLLIYDWGMKFLPMRYREPQKEWWGKRGLSIFGLALITKSEADQEIFQKFSYMVFLDNCAQDASSVTAIADYVLSQINNDFPKIKNRYCKCDNAGCFHNWDVLMALHGSAQQYKMKLKRVDFNDAGHGKDQADRDFAVIKAKFRAYVNSGHDILTAMDMKDALQKSIRPVKGLKAAVVELEPSAKQVDRKLAAPKVSGFHSFLFEPEAV